MIEAGNRRALEGQQALAAFGAHAQRRSLAAQLLVVGVEQAIFLEAAAEQGSGAERENLRACLFGTVEAKLDLALERQAALFLADGEELFLAAAHDEQERRAARGTWPSARLASCGVRTGCRLTRVMMSPRAMPARNAGLPCSTSETSTPCASDGARRRRAVSAVSAASVMPKPCDGSSSGSIDVRCVGGAGAFLVEIELVNGQRHGLLLLVAQDLHRHRRYRAWWRRPSRPARRGS